MKANLENKWPQTLDVNKAKRDLRKHRHLLMVQTRFAPPILCGVRFPEGTSFSIRGESQIHTMCSVRI